MQSDDIVLVTGATGRQGGATARELLARGWRVRALARNPDSAAAHALQNAGAHLVRGDLDDPASLEPALAGAYGVFSVQDFWGKRIGYDGEIRQARHLLEAAKRAGVEHVVQASIASCDRAPGVRHFECKHVIERMIDDLGLRRTFLRSVFYMDNFTHLKTGKLMFPILTGSLSPELRLHMVATEDIGRFAADAFSSPDRYLGQTVDIAGDLLSVPEMKRIYERATGRRPPGWTMPPVLLKLVNPDIARQFAWNHEPGWSFGLDSTRSRRTDVRDFETFLRRHHEARATPGAAGAESTA